jgi:hypothetical protein
MATELILKNTFILGRDMVKSGRSMPTCGTSELFQSLKMEKSLNA